MESRGAERFETQLSDLCEQTDCGSDVISEHGWLNLASNTTELDFTEDQPKDPWLIPDVHRAGIFSIDDELQSVLLNDSQIAHLRLLRDLRWDKTHRLKSMPRKSRAKAFMKTKVFQILCTGETNHKVFKNQKFNDSSAILTHGRHYTPAHVELGLDDSSAVLLKGLKLYFICTTFNLSLLQERRLKSESVFLNFF